MYSRLRVQRRGLLTLQSTLKPIAPPPSPPIHNTTPKHSMHSSPSLHKTPQLPPRPSLPDSDLKHVYLKGSGPGGQKINKTSSAVQLTHLPTGIVVKSQATRSQKQNHNIARKILAEKIEHMEKGGESRVAKKIELKVKRKRAAGKKSRRKYRRLAEEGEGEEEDEDGVEEGKVKEVGGEEWVQNLREGAVTGAEVELELEVAGKK